MTKREAIENHRKMWNWIADQIEQEKDHQHIVRLQREYMEQHGIAVSEPDFCCLYDAEHNNDCTSCPLIWCGDEKNLCFAIHKTCLYEYEYKEQARLAREIANMPEKSDGGNSHDQAGSN